MKKRKNFLRGFIEAFKKHKRLTVFIILTCLIGIYGIYRSAKAAGVLPQYTLSVARLGTITQTVTGSGQVSASNQTDIQSQASGTIEKIHVSVGQSVKAGDLIATIDDTNAAITLENARISYAKLTEPAKESDVTNAENNLAKAYNDAYNSASTIYMDLPAIMSGMKDLFYSRNGFLSDQTSTNLIPTGREYRQAAANAYDRAVNLYNASLENFKSLDRNSDRAKINLMVADTFETIKAVSEAVTKAQNAIAYIRTSQPDYYSAAVGTSAGDVNSWASQANSDLSSLISAQNSVTSSKNTLDTLIAGSDELDIQSAKLSLVQAQRTYDNYFVRAPYDGVIGRIPVNVYGQAGSGTTIATIVGKQKIASISLNEVDAAKVMAGQDVLVTFDAIDGLNATGTVSVVDQIGTVSSGVVSYGVKIAINTDDSRIRPGMSVNVTIVTKKIENTLVIPSVAIKSSGQTKYVQVLDRNLLGNENDNNSDFAANRNLASTSRDYSPTSTQAQRPVPASIFTRNGSTSGFTISTAIVPTTVTITTGESDDTNTQIIDGLQAGQLVVTKTLSTGTTQTTATPNILSSLTGRRTTGTGTGSRMTTTGTTVRTSSASAGGPPPGL